MIDIKGLGRDFADRLIPELEKSGVAARYAAKSNCIVVGENPSLDTGLVVYFRESRGLKTEPYLIICWDTSTRQMSRRAGKDVRDVAKALVYSYQDLLKETAETLERRSRAKAAYEWAEAVRGQFQIGEDEGPVQLRETEYASGKYVLQIEGTEKVIEVLNALNTAGVRLSCEPEAS